MGSLTEYRFEMELLNRTECDIHIFDPTVLPSRLREQEAQLNRNLPRRRIWWHSVGIGIKDDESGVCGSFWPVTLCQVYIIVLTQQICVLDMKYVRCMEYTRSCAHLKGM
jgi:hypothetical protein